MDDDAESFVQIESEEGALDWVKTDEEAKWVCNDVEAWLR